MAIPKSLINIDQKEQVEDYAEICMIRDTGEIWSNTRTYNKCKMILTHDLKIKWTLHDSTPVIGTLYKYTLWEKSTKSCMVV